MSNQYQKIIIGAGPAGLFSAIFAKQKGGKILLLEKNNCIGKKLAITGKGRCNITNNTSDLKELVSSYKKNGKFLYHAFSEFSVEDTLKFFNDLGIKTKIERGDRIFPESDDAYELIEKMYALVKDDILFNCDVQEILKDENHILGVKTNKGIFTADKYVIATGGKSYPLTGSNGDGYQLAKSLGHTIIEPKPALVPIETKEPWVRELAGLGLKNIRMDIYQNGKKQLSKFGELLFTHTGISGPIVIDCSREIGNLLEIDSVNVLIDLKPALSYPTLKDRINKDLSEAGNRAIKNSLSKLLPSSLIPVVIKLSGIDPEEKASQLSKESKNKLLHTLKELTLNITEIGDWNSAIVTDGGVDIKEIDPNTMQSKVVDNLYFAGEIIDVYGPTGGYNLQLCWSTGYLAGIS
ncbi:NAD(P)/FAD-dependent oxidoreductase [Patescibacteria group bacterium]|nr:NAD(P)/FAD-dependent oxidoreductase [Patescibacteria group bacterium]